MRLILSLFLIISAQIISSAEAKAQTQTPGSSIAIRDWMGNREDANVCGGYITFTVNVAKVTETDKPTFNWTTSSWGKIVNGQGTPAITIDTTGTNSDDASATVEVEGFPPECDKSASYKFSVILCGLVRADKVDEYDDLSRKIEGSHLDNFAIQLLQM